MDMKRTEKKNNENNISYLTLSIKLAFSVSFVVLCVWFVYKIGISVVGIYILVRSVLKITCLSIRVIFSLLSILFLVAIVMGIIIFIL